MGRRRVIAGLVGLALVAGVAFGFWLRQPRPCQATFERVQVGMTVEEVCATVGGEPGDYTEGRSLAYFVSTVGSGMSRSDDDRAGWAADDAYLDVHLKGGRVASIEIRDPCNILGPRPSLWDRLRARLGL